MNEERNAQLKGKSIDFFAMSHSVSLRSSNFQWQPQGCQKEINFENQMPK